MDNNDTDKGGRMRGWSLPQIAKMFRPTFGISFFL
jgi:hypothetical protein